MDRGLFARLRAGRNVEDPPWRYSYDGIAKTAQMAAIKIGMPRVTPHLARSSGASIDALGHQSPFGEVRFRGGGGTARSAVTRGRCGRSVFAASQA